MNYLLSSGSPLKKKAKSNGGRLEKRKVFFEYHIVEHCNLNCRSCSHFSTLAEPFYLDIQEFSRDLRQMKNIVGEHIARVSICGGEPLLHPGISEFITEAHAIFPNVGRRIMTNGILL
jgi:molybdenum cofactor biosynthesis enzyme MoaA